MSTLCVLELTPSQTASHRSCELICKLGAISSRNSKTAYHAEVRCSLEICTKLYYHGEWTCLSMKAQLLSIRISHRDYQRLVSSTERNFAKAVVYSLFMASLCTTRKRNLANSFPMLTTSCRHRRSQIIVKVDPPARPRTSSPPDVEKE